MQLRITAAEPQSANILRQVFLRHRGEFHQFRTQILQHLSVLPVIEAEGFISGHADSEGFPPFSVQHFPDSDVHSLLFFRKFFRSPGNFQNPTHIHVLLEKLCLGLQLLSKVLHLIGKHQPQVSAPEEIVFPVGQAAQHRNSQLFFDSRHENLAKCGGYSVQNHAGDSFAPVKIQKAFQFRNNRTSFSVAVCHQDNRRVQRLRHMIRGRLSFYTGQPVVQAHHAFDDRHIPGEFPAKNTPRPLFIRKKQVQISRRYPDDVSVVQGIDVIRPALKGTYRNAPLLQCPKQTAGHRRLSVPAAGGSDDNSWILHGFSPFCNLSSYPPTEDQKK